MLDQRTDPTPDAVPWRAVTVRGPVGAFLAAAGLWAALAAWRPTTTWHLAPVILAVAPAFARLAAGGPRAAQGARRSRLRPAMRWAVTAALGAGGSVLVAVVLALVGRLAGPTFTGEGSALGEAVLAAAVGGIVALLLPLGVRSTTTACADADGGADGGAAGAGTAAATRAAGRVTGREPTARRSVEDLPVSAFAAAVGGIAGGVGFGLVMRSTAMIPMVAALVGSGDPVVGWGVHLLISLLLSTAFGMAAYRVRSRWLVGAAAVAYGAAWWVLGALVLMPYLLGMPVLAVGTMAWASLAGHLVFGAGTAAGVLLLDRRDHW